MIKLIEKGGVTTPPGFKAAAAQAGLYTHKNDLGLIVADNPCAAAAVYTTNVVQADPIALTRTHLSNGTAQAILVNSGNANACAPNGAVNAQAVVDAAAHETQLAAADFIINSTGVVGVELPKDKLIAAIPGLVNNLAIGDEVDTAFSQAIMTTDTFPKSVAVQTTIGGVRVTIGAAAKGSGMIHPNMATMLAFVTTDAAITPALLHKALFRSVDISYNRVTVDGDTSTNDMTAILANGTAGNPLIADETSADYQHFLDALNTINLFLAKAIARDGEGATHFVTVYVNNADTESQATTLAKSVMGSSLVKTAIYGADANWGRILVAMGYSGVSFDKQTVALDFVSSVGRINVCQQGMGVSFSEVLAKQILTEQAIEIHIDMGTGSASSYAFGCDLTYDYVKINGDYRS